MSAVLIDHATGEIIEPAVYGASPVNDAHDLVPLDSHALDRLDPTAREAAIVGMLERSAALLAYVKRAGTVADAADVRAYLATVEAASRQIEVSKSIREDATELLRHAERALGVAIKRGQQEGALRRPSEGGGRPNKTDSRHESVSDIPRPIDLVNGGGQTLDDIYKMTDGVSDEQFDEAIEAAKGEGNLSRANVIRKIKGQESSLPVAQQTERIQELADLGYHSTQIAKDLGVRAQHIREVAKRAGIAIPADRIIGKARRIDPHRVIEQAVADLAATASTLSILSDHLSALSVTPEQAQEWADSVTESTRTINRIVKKVKESTHVQPQE